MMLGFPGGVPYNQNIAIREGSLCTQVNGSCFRADAFTLFVTQFLGAFNDNVFKNALVILITYTTMDNAGLSPQIMVTLAAGIFILPFFIFSATAGQLADKWDKARLIRHVKFVEIILMGGAAAGFYLDSVILLMMILFLMGAQSAFFGPLKYSILPDQLREDELIGGNALVSAGTFIAILLGTIIGGLLILAEQGGAIVSGITIGIALAGWLSSLFIPRSARQQQIRSSTGMCLKKRAPSSGRHVRTPRCFTPFSESRGSGCLARHFCHNFPPSPKKSLVEMNRWLRCS